MTVVRYLHLVAMAFFVGGQLFLVAAVVPSFRSRPDREPLRAAVRLGALGAIAVLIGTGVALASRSDQWGNGTLHVKLALVPVVAALVVWHMRRPQLHALEGLVFIGSLAIVWLGASLAH
jgi:peptidoglycan/LPS O-acetylase OafA/YrhL